MHDHDFCQIYKDCENAIFKYFYRHNDFLFKGIKMCVPKSPMWELFVKESHEGGLMGHFRIQKILDILHGQFFWSHMKHEVLFLW